MFVSPLTSAVPRGRGAAASRQPAGFTLIELLVVIGIIGIFIGVIGFAFRKGANDSVGLQAAQAQLVSLLTQARSEAAVSGRDAALFVCDDFSVHPERYMHYLIVASQDDSGNWSAIGDGVTLPPGCYVVSPTETWAGPKSAALSDPISATFVSNSPENWRGISFSPRGTVAATSARDIVIATGQPNPPTSSTPFTLTNPDNVRGVKLSTYGFATIINDAESF